MMTTPHKLKPLATIISPPFDSPSPIPIETLSTHTPSCMNQKRMSKLGMGVGPALPASLLRSVFEGNISHLNLHANQLIHLNTDETIHQNHQLLFEVLTELDVSSNCLGEKQNSCHVQSQEKMNSYNSSTPSLTNTGPNLLTMLPNLQYLNLSANNLTSASLSWLFSTQGNMLVPISLPNLVRLELSHNRLTKLSPSILHMCPRLETLSLLNNRIKSISDLLEPFHQLNSFGRTEQTNCMETLKYLSLQNHNGNDNPVCKIREYRVKIIGAFPCLIQLDDVEATEIEAEQGSKYSTVPPARPTKQLQKKLYHKGCKTRPKGSIEDEPLNKKQVERKETREDRIKRATENISLHKLNQLEDQVRALSKIAGEQAEATQMLLQRNQDGNDNDNDNHKYATYPKERTQILTVSKSQVQTSFMHDSLSETSSPLPSPPSSPAPDMMTAGSCSARNILVLHLAVEKWRTFTLSKTIIESKQASTNKLKEELGTLRHQYENEREQLETKLSTKDEQLIKLQNKISLLAEDFKRQKEKEMKLEKMHRRDIERIARMAEDELEGVHKEYCQRINQERYRTDIITKKCNERFQQANIYTKESKDEIKDMQQCLHDERNKSRALLKQLQSHQDTALQELKRVELSQAKKLQEVKRAYEAVAKRSATDKATAEKLLCDLRNASKCISSQKDQLQTLKLNLSNRDAIIRKNQHDHSAISQEKNAFEDDLHKIKASQKALLQKINENDATIRRYKRDTKLLQAEIADNTYRQENMLLEMKQLKKEKLNTLKTSQKLQSDYENVRNEFECFREDRASNASLSKIEALREAKKKYKKEVRHLRACVQDLKQDLATKEHIVETKTRETIDIQDTFKEKQSEFERNYDSCQKTNQGLKARLESMCNKLKDVRGHRDELTKKNQTIHSENSQCKEERDAAKDGMIALQTKLDEHSQMAKLALSQLCEGFTAPSQLRVK